jgi:2-C-methyl-D-erythritol 2,4-cyclodiphosphate synthase
MAGSGKAGSAAGAATAATGATTATFAGTLRIGHGYDVHAFGEGRRCVLGGVDVPCERGLVGHSDADVLAHALADALLGAARLGDIGQLFPDTDPAYEGADSLVLLSRVAGRVRREGFEVVDCDCTVAAQVPKLAPHRDAMRANLARALGVDVSCVGVKATTTERLGFVGREEGIEAWAVALLARVR